MDDDITVRNDFGYITTIGSISLYDSELRMSDADFIDVSHECNHIIPTSKSLRDDLLSHTT